MENFQNILNKSQFEAVNTINGPVLVIAGAGSGKTRVIEYRVLNLILNNIEPSSILLLTFTRKASREMLDRSSKHDIRCAYVDGGTFHSFAYRTLRKYYDKIGFEPNFSFMDEADVADVLYSICKKLGYLEMKERFPTKATLREIISMSVNRNMGIGELLDKEYSHFLHLVNHIERLRQEYVGYKKEKSMMDYDDMLIYLRTILEDEVVRKEVADKYKFIMVDEFQDTNKIQADITFLLGKTHGNVMVVGDDTQSIYSFRGAYHKNMFDFPKMFPKTKIIKLEVNYRSTQPILDVANALIENAEEKYTKILRSEKGGGDTPKLYCFKDMESEVTWIADKIKDLIDEGVGMNEIAVLYRSNYLSALLQFMLTKLEIPFIVYGGIKFVETAHVKDVLAHLRIALNPMDESAWRRSFMLLDKVGASTAGKLYAEISKNKDWNIGIGKYLKGYKYSEGLFDLLELLNSIKSTKIGLKEKVKQITEYYFPIMQNMYDDYPRREEDLLELIEIADKYESIEQFIADFVIIDPPQKNNFSDRYNQAEERPVVLSTVHSAKGLEWDSVFVMSLNDGCLPNSYSLDNIDSLEEEKRLLYVALTRAKRNLFLSWHYEGNNGNSYNKLSRFIVSRGILNRLSIFAGDRRLDMISDPERYFE
jgi:DNA helicase-2/ATP-dependent DNA helicase PcrA